MANFPGSLSSLATNKADGTTTATDHPAHHNALADEVNAIEAELGIDTAGPFATTVRERFEILDFKRSVRVASTANIAGTYATGPPATKAVGGTSLAIDGITLANGDRVLLKNQSTGLENGLYSVSGVGTSIVLTRTYDGDASNKMSDAMFVGVEDGTQADAMFELMTSNPITLGTTALVYQRVDMKESPWMDLMDVGAPLGSAAGAATYLGHNAATTNVTAATALSGQIVTTFRFDPADYTIPGRTQQFRVILSLLGNNTAPGTVTYTGSLYVVTGTGATTAFTLTLGAQTGSTAAIVTPGANANVRTVGAAYTAPAAATYTLGVVTSGAGAANSVLRAGMKLQTRWV